MATSLRGLIPPRSLLLGLAAGLLCFGFVYALNATLARFSLHANETIIDDVIIGGLVAILITFLDVQHQRDHDRQQERISIIMEMNHHIRNALQIIVYANAQNSDREIAQKVAHATTRIEWALSEVLPGPGVTRKEEQGVGEGRKDPRRVSIQGRRNVILRPETSSDYDAIRQINIDAFANHPYSQHNEHLIVEALRSDGALTISLVAEVEHQVVGHIAFSSVRINGEDLAWFALGPVAVLPGMQRKGIGKALVEEGLESLRTLRAQGCVLVGEPDYYHRFGFRQNPALTLPDVPPKFFLCLPMAEHIPTGTVQHHPAFSVRAC